MICDYCTPGFPLHLAMPQERLAFPEAKKTATVQRQGGQERRDGIESWASLRRESRSTPHTSPSPASSKFHKPSRNISIRPWANKPVGNMERNLKVHAASSIQTPSPNPNAAFTTTAHKQHGPVTQPGRNYPFPFMLPKPRDSLDKGPGIWPVVPTFTPTAALAAQSCDQFHTAPPARSSSQ
jgi:hypothetical protein